MAREEMRRLQTHRRPASCNKKLYRVYFQVVRRDIFCEVSILLYDVDIVQLLVMRIHPSNRTLFDRRIHTAGLAPTRRVPGDVSRKTWELEIHPQSNSPVVQCFPADSFWPPRNGSCFLTQIFENSPATFFLREDPTGSDCHEARIYVNRPQAMPCAVVAPALLVCTARFFFVAMHALFRTYICICMYTCLPCRLQLTATYARTDRGDATAHTVP